MLSWIGGGGGGVPGNQAFGLYLSARAAPGERGFAPGMMAVFAVEGVPEGLFVVFFSRGKIRFWSRCCGAEVLPHTHNTHTQEIPRLTSCSFLLQVLPDQPDGSRCCHSRGPVALDASNTFLNGSVGKRSLPSRFQLRGVGGMGGCSGGRFSTGCSGWE